MLVKMTTTNWSYGFLITFWVLQLLVCIVGWFFGAVALNVKSLFTDHHNVEGAGKALEYFRTSGVLWISFSSVSFILIVAEIVMLAKHDLRPAFAVASGAIKTTLWLVVFIIALSNIALGSFSVITLIVYAIFLVMFAIPLVYTSYMLRRHRKILYTPVVTQSV
ncbi:hypothetical protein D6D26_05584 [Aureobasidium pullulans]|nr:hypothetical protein D6D26_05584 [Aureobasidium pullulans]